MRRIFITGASSGLGEALARLYAQEGAHLGLVARRLARLESLAAELPAPVRLYRVDVKDASSMQAAAQDFLAQAGVPDIVIANAGVSSGTLTEEAEDLPAFRRIIETNVLGILHTFHPFLAPMRARGEGRLVGIASVAGLRGLPGAGAYSASKAAALAYLESLRVELRATGVKVVAIAPGYIDTPMTQVNPYPMPFLLPVDEAARRIRRIIEQGRPFAVIPWPMAIVARILRFLPPSWFDAMAYRAGRKPRGLV
ncbi:MAG: SDR family oxidoreductase [Rhodocyclaceae bacterium]|nr:SDR family oxidoreductase [Rhodocyclaceae bacterium]